MDVNVAGLHTCSSQMIEKVAQVLEGIKALQDEKKSK